VSCGRCRPLRSASLSAPGKPCPLICARREQPEVSGRWDFRGD
jgi:hypothetical protein